jgi:hypothetical protein
MSDCFNAPNVARVIVVGDRVAAAEHWISEVARHVGPAFSAFCY